MFVTGAVGRDRDKIVLMTEDDLIWLAEWVARYLLAETGEMANHLLIHLDRKLYCPF